MKRSIIMGLFCILVFSIGYFIFINKNKVERKSVKTEKKERVEKINDTKQLEEETKEFESVLTDVEKEKEVLQNAVKFRGNISKYYTGCFSDGECYVVVDGKHVTTVLGWSGDEVGVFENPDVEMGTELEVYALPKNDGSYTLYGSKDFYIKEVE